MRVLFTTFAAKTHLYSQVPLAWAMQTAGHDVYVASQPDLADTITGAGLTAVPVGEALNLEERMREAGDGLGRDANDSVDLSELRSENLRWEDVLEPFTTMTALAFQNQCPESMVDDVVALARHWRPDLVIWDPLTFAGPVAARAVGAAHARLLFGPDLIAQMRSLLVERLAQRPPDLRDDPLAEWLGWTAERYGVSFDEELVTGQWTIDPLPPTMRLPVDLHYVGVRGVPYNPRAVVPDWLREPPNRPRVCLTLGMSHGEANDERTSISDLLASVADLDVAVVATLDAQQRKHLSQIPDNVRAVDFVPLNALLPTCAAVIHHGGSGTFATALARGVPQLIVGDRTWDTPHKAAALVRSGAGLFVRDAEGLSAEELRGQLVRLLDEPSFATAADRLRHEILGLPSPNEVVPALERLTAANRA